MTGSATLAIKENQNDPILRVGFLVRPGLLRKPGYFARSVVVIAASSILPLTGGTQPHIPRSNGLVIATCNPQVCKTGLVRQEIYILLLQSIGNVYRPTLIQLAVIIYLS